MSRPREITVLKLDQIPTYLSGMSEKQRSGQPRQETPGVKGNKQFAAKHRYEAATTDLADQSATVESDIDPYVQSQVNAAATFIATKFPNIESISFRAEEDWDNTIEGEEGEEWAALKAVVIDVIEKNGEEFDGDEYEDAEAIGVMLDAELTQAGLRDVFDNDTSIPVFLD